MTQTVNVVESTAPFVPAGVTWHADEPAPIIARLGDDGTLGVTELTLDRSGAASPFGDDIVFPLPVESLRYQPPSPTPPED